MFKSVSTNNQKHLRIGDGGGGGGGGGRFRSKSKAPATTCKKHPKHQQSPGVCAVCLREKLTHIPASSSKITRGNNVASSSSSYLSSLSSQDISSNASSCSSPIHRHRYSRSYSSLTTVFKRGKRNNDSSSSTNIVFTKSRSLAFLMQRPEAQVVEEHDGKKKQGFWSKLLRSRTKNKKGQGSMKSRTLQQNNRP